MAVVKIGLPLNPRHLAVQMSAAATIAMICSY
jgi:hypothetical protein